MPSQPRAVQQAANLQRHQRGNVHIATLSCISGALLLLGFHSLLQAAVPNPTDSKQEVLISISKFSAGSHAGRTSPDSVSRLNSQEGKDRADQPGVSSKTSSWALPEIFGQQAAFSPRQLEEVNNRIAPVARVEVAGSTASASRPDESGAQSPAAASAAKGGADADVPASDAVNKEAAQVLLDKWARAWSEREVDQYLGLYGEDFRPENGLSRSAWAQSRRQKIESRKNISVSVRDLNIEKDGEKHLNVSFLQDYQADSFRELGTPKQLTLALEGGSWKIVAETIGSTPPKKK